MGKGLWTVDQDHELQDKFSANWLSLALAVLLYASLTLFVTYPVAFRLPSVLAGVEGEDALQHLWISWWTEKALIHLGISPAWVPLLYYPDGVHHPMLWVTPYPQVAAMPLILLFGPVVAHNVHLLLSFVLTGLSAYLLCHYLTGNKWAASIGGLIFAFFPSRTIQATAHFAQVVTYWFPLYALYLFRLYQRPNRRDAALCGLFLALSLLVNIVHIAYFVIPFTVLFLIYCVWRERRAFSSFSLTKGLAVAFGLAALLTGPFLLPFVFLSLTGRLDYLSMGGVVEYSTDLLAFFTPSALHPLRWQVARLLGQDAPLQALATALIGQGNPQENIAYLGLVPLLLAAWGLWRSRSRVGFWPLLGLTAAILSLGPRLKVGGWRTDIPLPYALLEALPFYQWGRVPGRLNETITLSVAVLAAYGMADILERFARPRFFKMGTGTTIQAPCKAATTPPIGNRRSGRQALLFTVLVVLITFEYWTVWPFPTMEATVPDFYHCLAEEPGDFAVLDLPQWPIWLRRASNYAMYYQTIHGHPIVGGYVWRLPEGLEGTIKAFQELVLPPVKADVIQRPLGEDAVKTLHYYKVKYVILHKGLWEAEDEAAAVSSLGRLLGPPLYEGPEAIAFTVPNVGDGSGREELLALSYNWYNVEMLDGRPARWLKNDGAIYIHRLAEGRYRLCFAVYPFHGPRRLQVSVDGDSVADWIVEGWRELTTPTFTLRKGGNEIAFHVVEGCGVPAEISPDSQDRRCLSLLFQDIRLLPVEGEGMEFSVPASAEGGNESER